VETTRDLGCAELWALSLERSLARRGRPRRASVELYRLKPERDLSSPRPLRESSAYWQIRRTAAERAEMPLSAAGSGAALVLLAATALPSLLGGRGARAAVHARAVDPTPAADRLSAAIATIAPTPVSSAGEAIGASTASLARQGGTALAAVERPVTHRSAVPTRHPAPADGAVRSGSITSVQHAVGITRTAKPATVTTPANPGAAKPTATLVADAVVPARATDARMSATRSVTASRAAVPTAGPTPGPVSVTHAASTVTRLATHQQSGGASPPIAGPVAAATQPSARPTTRPAAPALTGVQALQQRLGVAVDGDFGPLTKAAVERFQRARGLTPNGVVDAATREALGLGPGPVLQEPAAAAAPAQAPIGTQTATSSGGSSIGSSTPTSGAGAEIAEMIAAANQIATAPYVYGGGHASFESVGYDCSGSVSYVLHAAGLLSSPEDSTELESYGAPGPGRYVTIYATDGHAWMTIDGRRFDTVALAETGTRWSSGGGEFAGYVERHPVGL